MANLFEQILLAVEALHKKKIGHGDLKPANILLTEGGMVKLADFGISQDIAGDTTHYSVKIPVGTNCYIAWRCLFGKAMLENKSQGKNKDFHKLGPITINSLSLFIYTYLCFDTFFQKPHEEICDKVVIDVIFIM